MLNCYVQLIHLCYLNDVYVLYILLMLKKHAILKIKRVYRWKREVG